jgi:ketosteroid isomerase-like protein
MSSANVELVRRLQPGPDVDLAHLFRDDDAAAELLQGAAHFFPPDFECVMVLPTYGRRTYAGLEGLRAGWLDWLEPWASYRVEIEDFIEIGDRVLVLVRDFGSHEPGGHEIALNGCAVWTVREGEIARAEFFAIRADAFAAVGLPEPA